MATAEKEGKRGSGAPGGDGTIPPMNAPRQPVWDIFCNVIDNFGDIGVSWRLARQLARERGFRVRLWVDDLDRFYPLLPSLAPAQGGLFDTAEGVEVRPWTADFPPVTPGEVVIETFGCRLPEAYLQAMAALPRPPFWVNLEYLSGEDWVGECHGLTSPHPRLPLVTHYFFPGFTPESGGLLREGDLLDRRERFAADPTQAARLRDRLGLPADTLEGSALRVLLFTYGHLPVAPLLDAWSRGDRPIHCLLPPSPALPQIQAWVGEGWEPGRGTVQRGQLRLSPIPFLPQEDFDALLWFCHINFVRGEDSFVRAQWAGLPLVWQIYPQEEEAHLVKLRAFLKLYLAQAPAELAQAISVLWEAWNRGLAVAAPWQALVEQLPQWQQHSHQWGQSLAAQGDLCSQLLTYMEKSRESPV